ncbi:MAG TPA: glycosyltransferase family 39 protein [Anaerolineales bacterium]|nr:glycosyltransferase family 39 protein [Anaerolineales bacterium]
MLRSRAVFILIALFLLIGSIYAVTTPLFEASDELWHYPLVQHLAQGGALPVQDPNNVGPWRQEASQPPLYYCLMGRATAWIDTSDMPQVRWLNPHVDNGIITPDGNINLAIHTPAENFPWRGTVLAVRLVRLISVLMSAGTVLFTYLLAREFFDIEIERLAAAAFVAFTPMFTFISGAVNNDDLASLFSAAILFLLVYFVRRPDWGWFSRFGSRAGLAACLTLGILLGFAALTKQSALGLFPLAGLTLIAISLQQSPCDAADLQSTIRKLKSEVIPHLSFIIRHSSFVFLPALLLPSWWYYRNIVLYGDVLGWNAFIAVLGKRAAPASLLQLWGERESFTRSYWGLFGGVNVPMSGWIYTTLNAIALLALLGFILFLVQTSLKLFRLPTRPFSLSPVPFVQSLNDTLPDWFRYTLLLGHLALILYGLITWATVTWSSQGRLVFSGISAIAILFVLGLRTILPTRPRPLALGAIVLFMAVVTAVSPFTFIAPKYTDPPPLTPDQIAAIARRTDVDFGSINFPPEMRLLGYALEMDNVRPGGEIRLTLYWQSLAVMDRDWSVFVHVVDEHGIVVAQRDTYPGLGLMPTRKWAVGQTVADTYVINVPPTTFAPSGTTIQIGLYDYNSGDRLVIVTDGHPDAGRDALTLSALAIVANLGDLPNPQSLNFGGQIELAGYDMDRRALRAGESFVLTLYWRSLKPMTVNYSVFAHVRGAGESLWAQSDSWPQDSAAPTAAWTVGQVVVDTRSLTIRPDTAPGVYDVEVGLYDERGDRLQLVLPDGRLADNFTYLSKIRVLP